MKIGSLFLATVLIASFQVAWSQEETAAAEGAAPEKSLATVDTLLAALDNLAARDGYVLTGRVASRDPEGEKKSAGMQMIVIGGGGGAGESFSGGIEVWRTGDDELIVLSRSPLPGLGFFDDGDRSITQTCYEDEPVDTKRVTGDLGSLLDIKRLKKAIGKGKLTATVDSGSGAITYGGEISSKAVRSVDAGSPMAMMAPTVLRVEADFVVSEEGALEGCRFTIVRSDPMAGIRRKAASGALTGGEQIQLGAPEPSDEEGKSDVYTLRVSKRGPSKRALAFREQIGAIIEEEAF
jgi:hypothetical protein